MPTVKSGAGKRAAPNGFPTQSTMPPLLVRLGGATVSVFAT